MLTQRIDSTKAPSIQIGPLGFNAALLSSPAFSEPDLSRQRHPEPTMQSSNPLLSEHEYTNKHCSSTMDLLDGTDRSSAPVERYYLDAEAKAAEQTFQLKSELKNVTMAADFWEALTDGMSKVAGAQYAFVSKREIGLEDIRTTESPPTPPGEETEHHLLGLAVHFNDGKGNKRLHRNWMYRACDFMISEKVVLIPTSLDEQYNPGESNSLAFSAPAESYLAVPLRLHNKCIGHMGLLWTKEGIKSRPWLSWPYLEMFLHALEDTVCSQILDRNQYNIRAIRAYQYGPQGCPLSLKPYARRVSHELRTPMQGVVGILDLLNMSVLQIARMDNLLPEMREVIEGMLENIEMAQDSSRGAVYAAENMVHAYDLNMEVPNSDERHDLSMSLHLNSHRRRRGSSVSQPVDTPNRTRTFDALDPSAPGTTCLGVIKHERLRGRPRSSSSPPQGRLPLESTPKLLETIVPTSGIVSVSYPSPTPPGTVALIFDATGKFLLNSRPIKLREFLHDLVHECLKIGGRPESTHTVDSELGEVVTVTRRGCTSKSSVTTIELSVDSEVPNFLIIDELALKKLLSCVFHNAVKFTEGGNIKLMVTNVQPPSRYVVFSIKDTGKGIKREFLPNLFKAFAREDTTITRRLDGLGLGLLVAKGLARKMGGDVWCEQTATEGPLKGSEFLVKLPTSPANASSSLPGTPLKSPETFIATPISSVTLVPNAPPSLELDSNGISLCNSTIGRFISAAAQKLSSPPNTFPTTLLLEQISSSETLVISPEICPTFSPSPLSTMPSSPLAAIQNFNGIPPPAIACPSPPATNSNAPNPSCSNTYTPDPNLGKTHPLRILIAEDNKINRTLLAKMLRKLGFTEIYEAVDGIDAVQKAGEINMKEQLLYQQHLKSNQPTAPLEIPNLLVLMDIWMPNMDGFEASKRILNLKCSSPSSSSVKIVAVSADVTRKALRKSVDVGMAGFMAKPYRMEELERVILELCVEWRK